MKAKKLNTILLVIIVLMIVGIGLGFYFVQNAIQSRTIETNVLMAKADKQNETPVVKIGAKDESTKSLAQKTLAMLTNSNDIELQTKNTIDKYASESGLVINSFNLLPTDNSTTDPTNLAIGLKIHKIVVGIGSPASFSGLMKFTKALETTTPKMQITSINLSNIRANKDAVTIEPITIEVYTR
ncbi:MAG: hypothetical protein WCP11_02240 [Candidatus Saccharibacteria bacterium]